MRKTRDLREVKAGFLISVEEENTTEIQLEKNGTKMEDC